MTPPEATSDESDNAKEIAAEGDIVEEVATDEAPDRRLKFYGMGDFATYWQAEQVVGILEQYDASNTSHTISEVIELHNVQLFAEHDLFPSQVPEE